MNPAQKALVPVRSLESMGFSKPIPTLSISLTAYGPTLSGSGSVTGPIGAAPSAAGAASPGAASVGGSPVSAGLFAPASRTGAGGAPLSMAGGTDCGGAPASCFGGGDAAPSGMVA